jgi:tetratricopeptide (TPR) repeat protein
LLDAALSAIKRDDKVRAEQFASFSLELLETAQGYSILGEISNSRDEDERALEYWSRALRLEPNHYFTLIDLGKFYLTKQDIGRAVEYLDKAIALEPRKPRARHLRGLAYQSVGDYGHANREYVEAFADRSYGRTVKPFYLNFGTSLFAAGHYEEAAKMLEEYTRLAPNDAEGYYQLGAAYEVAAERSLTESFTYRAIDAFKRSLALRPNHAMSHYYLSKAYRRIGKYEEAEIEFELYERYLAK